MRFESQLVSTVASNPELLTTISVSPDEFEDRRAGKIFEVVSRLIAEKKVPDSIMVTELLNFETGGEWLQSVLDVFEHPSIPANLETYEQHIKENYQYRELGQIAHQLVVDSSEHNPSAATNAITGLQKISTCDSRDIVSVSDVVDETIKHVDDLHNNLVEPGLQTGIYHLDRLTGGFQKTDSIVIAARTSVGKTAFMCNLSVNMKCPVGIISGEQSRNQIVSRCLAKIGSVSAQRMRTGHLHDDEFPRLVNAGIKLKESKIFINDKSRPSIEDIEQNARKMKWDYDIGILFIDYLQLIQNRRYPDKRLQISDISQRLKGLAQELDIPVVTLAQLNRNAVDKVPKLSDLKESGSIEEDADQVILLYKGDETPEGQLTVSVQKNRNGMTSHFEVLWEPEYMRVRNFT